MTAQWNFKQKREKIKALLLYLVSYSAVIKDYIFSCNTLVKVMYYFNLQLARIWPSTFITQSMAETNNFTLKAYCYIVFNNENTFWLQK